MAKKDSKTGGAQEGRLPLLNRSNIEDVEIKTIKKVSRTLTVLEGALAKWEASEERPKELKEKFARYKRFHDALTEWETTALRARGKAEGFDTTVQRLKRFVEICYSYA